jgi:hypothetical protein
VCVCVCVCVCELVCVCVCVSVCVCLCVCLSLSVCTGRATLWALQGFQGDPREFVRELALKKKALCFSKSPPNVYLICT